MSSNLTSGAFEGDSATLTPREGEKGAVGPIPPQGVRVTKGLGGRFLIESEGPKEGSFGARLKIARKSRELKLQGFADAIGYCKSYLSKLERGNNLHASEDFIKAVCDAFSINREWLVNGVGEAPQPLKDTARFRFKDQLQKLMEARKVNSAQIAREIGVSHVAIGNYLKGQLPKSEHLWALARFFNVAMESLLGVATAVCAAPPASVEPSENLERWQKERTEPLELTLPSPAGGECGEKLLLRYVCGVLAERGPAIREFILPGIEAWDKSELMAGLLMAGQIPAEFETSPLFLQGTLKIQLPGLAGQREWTFWEILDFLCLTVFHHRERLLSLVNKARPFEGLGIVEMLVIAEKWVFRQGLDCELSRVEGTVFDPSPLQKLCWEIMAAAFELRFQESGKGGQTI